MTLHANAVAALRGQFGRIDHRGEAFYVIAARPVTPLAPDARLPEALAAGPLDGAFDDLRQGRRARLRHRRQRIAVVDGFVARRTGVIANLRERLRLRCDGARSVARCKGD